MGLKKRNLTSSSAVFICDLVDVIQIHSHYLHCPVNWKEKNNVAGSAALVLRLMLNFESKPDL